MSIIKKRGGMVLLVTLVISFALSIVPYPESIKMFQPEWIVLVMVYWLMALPDRMGVGIAWIIGLFLDVVRDGLLGQHALALAVVAFIVLKIYQRLRNFPLWQQSVSIFFLILIQSSIVVWIKSLSGMHISWWMFFLPALMSAIFWPLIYIVMRLIRRHFHIT